MKDRDEKKFIVIPFFGAINFTKLNYFIFENLKKKNLGQFSKNYRTFTQTIVTKLSNIWVWDPRSEIRDRKITYSGSRIQGSKRHRIPDPQYCIFIRNIFFTVPDPQIFNSDLFLNYGSRFGKTLNYGSGQIRILEIFEGHKKKVVNYRYRTKLIPGTLL
jgi:hypothetical protein